MYILKYINLSLAPFFARSLTLVPLSLILNHTETLATQPNFHQKGFTPGLIFLSLSQNIPKAGSDERREYSQAYIPKDATLIVMNE